MIIPHNPNLISWSACRTYRRKQETGSKSTEKAEMGFSPMRSLLVRIRLGLFRIPPEQDIKPAPAVMRSRLKSELWIYCEKSPAGFLLFMMGMQHADANGGAQYS